MNISMFECGVLKVEDLPLVAEIEQSAFAHPWRLSQLREQLANPTTLAFSGVHEGVLCAYAIFQIVLDEAELLRIAVSSGEQRLGYGQQLLSYAIKTLYLLNVERIFLEVNRHNAPAIALYQKLGFQQFGVRAAYYDGIDALLFSKERRGV